MSKFQAAAKIKLVYSEKHLNIKQLEMEARINKQHNYPQRTTTSEWNRMVVTDNNVMKLEMRFLLIFIFRKQ